PPQPPPAQRRALLPARSRRCPPSPSQPCSGNRSFMFLPTLASQVCRGLPAHECGEPSIRPTAPAQARPADNAGASLVSLSRRALGNRWLRQDQVSGASDEHAISAFPLVVRR